MKLFTSHKTVISFLLLSTLFVAKTAAQEETAKPDYFLEGGVRYGIALYHPKHDIYLRDLNFGSLELRFGMQTHGAHVWEKAMNYPIVGVALRFTDYTGYFDQHKYQLAGTQDYISAQQIRRRLLGQNIALFGYVQVPIVRYKWFTWHCQMGMGVGAFTRMHSDETISVLDYTDDDGNPLPQTDPKTRNLDNDLISLRLTPYINLQSGFDFRLTRQLDLTLNANFTHASNASMNMPNYGINEVQGIVGLRYHLNKSAAAEEKVELQEPFKASNALFFTIDPGWLWSRYNNYYYLKTNVSIGYERQVLPILRVGGALEFNMANRLAPTPEYQPVYSDGTSYDLPQQLFAGSVYGFGDLTFGRFALHVGVGAYYFRSPFDIDLSMSGAYGGTLDNPAWVYEKVGFKIALGKRQNHFVGAGIRAHFPVADYLSFTYGYRFFRF